MGGMVMGWRSDDMAGLANGRCTFPNILGAIDVVKSRVAHSNSDSSSRVSGSGL